MKQDHSLSWYIRGLIDGIAGEKSVYTQQSYGLRMSREEERTNPPCMAARYHISVLKMHRRHMLDSRVTTVVVVCLRSPTRIPHGRFGAGGEDRCQR